MDDEAIESPARLHSSERSMRFGSVPDEGKKSPRDHVDDPLATLDAAHRGTSRCRSRPPRGLSSIGARAMRAAQARTLHFARRRAAQRAPARG